MSPKPILLHFSTLQKINSNELSIVEGLLLSFLVTNTLADTPVTSVSAPFLSKETGVSISSIRKSLALFKETGLLSDLTADYVLRFPRGFLQISDSLFKEKKLRHSSSRRPICLPGPVLSLLREKKILFSEALAIAALNSFEIGTTGLIRPNPNSLMVSLGFSESTVKRVLSSLKKKKILTPPQGSYEFSTEGLLSLDSSLLVKKVKPTKAPNPKSTESSKLEEEESLANAPIIRGDKVEVLSCFRSVVNYEIFNAWNKFPWVKASKELIPSLCCVDQVISDLLGNSTPEELLKQVQLLRKLCDTALISPDKAKFVPGWKKFWKVDKGAYDVSSGLESWYGVINKDHPDVKAVVADVNKAKAESEVDRLLHLARTEGMTYRALYQGLLDVKTTESRNMAIKILQLRMDLQSQLPFSKDFPENKVLIWDPETIVEQILRRG